MGEEGQKYLLAKCASCVLHKTRCAVPSAELEGVGAGSVVISQCF